MQFEEHLHNISHDFNWNSASHAHSVIAELLVYIYAMVCIHVSQKTSVAFNLCCCIETEWWGACAVICLEWGVQTCVWPSWFHGHSLSLASVKSRLVLPFWYRLTWVVLEKRPCVCVCVCMHSCVYVTLKLKDFFRLPAVTSLKMVTCLRIWFGLSRV